MLIFRSLILGSILTIGGGLLGTVRAQAVLDAAFCVGYAASVPNAVLGPNAGVPTAGGVAMWNGSGRPLVTPTRLPSVSQLQPS